MVISNIVFVLIYVIPRRLPVTRRMSYCLLYGFLTYSVLIINNETFFNETFRLSLSRFQTNIMPRLVWSEPVICPFFGRVRSTMWGKIGGRASILQSANVEDYSSRAYSSRLFHPHRRRENSSFVVEVFDRLSPVTLRKASCWSQMNTGFSSRGTYSSLSITCETRPLA